MLDVAIRKRLGTFELDARFDLPEGGLIALFGRSGSGKTSTVSAIAGLLRPDSGHIRLGDSVLFDRSARVDVPAHRRRVGYVFQDSRLFPHLRVHDNLLFGYRRSPRNERRIAPEHVIALLGLESLLERRPSQLSGGEKQRVAIGRALLAQPRILLMDEPLASLDAPRKRQILPYIERLRDELRVAIVYVSHALEEVVRLADRIVVFEAGRVAAVGTPEELSQDVALRPLFGDYEAGVVLDAEITSHDVRFGITTLAFQGGALRVPDIRPVIGQKLRVRVRERDVSLATAAPANLSIQNVLEGTVHEVWENSSPVAEVKVRVGESMVIARVTRESVHRLALSPGKPVWALVKSVSLEDRGGSGA